MKTHQTFRLDSDVAKKALKLAEEENRSLSNFYSNAVIAYVLMKELKTKKK